KRRGRKEVWMLKIDDRTFYLKRRWASLWTFTRAFIRGGTLGFWGFNEWRNLMRVIALGIPTMTPVAAGARWRKGIHEAFLMTEAIENACPLDEFFRNHFHPPLTPDQIQRKRQIILMVADIVRKLHTCGLYHQDLFVYHMVVRETDDGRCQVYLFDLDRLVHPIFPWRSRIKDLAKLFLSCYYHAPLSATDRLRFYRAYIGRNHYTEQDIKLWYRVWRKARWVEQHDPQFRNVVKRLPTWQFTSKR
ncbi:MAG TPA: hypothetical protein EYP10_02805, partial [Armatimonadetes bacterium]|nr:hypothetical protein [Armatimonadota bacterium]